MNNPLRVDSIVIKGRQTVSISRSDFAVLAALACGEASTQRQLSAVAGVSLGTANRVLRSLEERGLVKDFDVTEAGCAALRPYKVENAIIMAAGISARFAPLSYEKPKGLFEVRGEVLIERQIRQLKSVGIDDITVVVGYMKESFFYLEGKFGVRIAVNPEYASRNNNATLMLVRERMGNTYICSSDNYYTENPFRPYRYQSEYACVAVQGSTDEYVAEATRSGDIKSVSCGGSDSWALMGYAYFDHAFSQAFRTVLERVYDIPDTKPKLWEDIFAEHVRELPAMRLRPFPEGVIYEFDYFNDLAAFDGDFLANVDSDILDNICRTLSCERADIVDVEPVKAGLTNLSVLFSVKGSQYVYRHPGDGTSEIINREAETYALQVAKKLGLDDTFVFEDPQAGWKISRYVAECVPFSYRNPDHVSAALSMARHLHTSGEESPWSFDFAAETNHIVELLRARSYPLPAGFSSLHERIASLADDMRADDAKSVLCHNDFYGPNVLVAPEGMYLIDWEYAAMGDYGCDVGNFFAQGSGYTVAESIAVMDLYFGRPATDEEVRHCLACTSIVGFYWYVWAMYKESEGNAMGEWLYRWYRSALDYADAAEPLYRAGSKVQRSVSLQQVWEGKERSC